MEKSQVDKNFQAQSAIDINYAVSYDNLKTEEAAKIGVEVKRSINSINIRNENSQVCENTGRTKKKQRQLTCDFCQKEFNHAGDLNKHRRKHTGEQPYTCNKCQQKFSHTSNLARHQRVHSGMKPFSCETCGRTFSRKDKYSAHLTMKHCITKL